MTWGFLKEIQFGSRLVREFNQLIPYVTLIPWVFLKSLSNPKLLANSNFKNTSKNPIKKAWKRENTSILKKTIKLAQGFTTKDTTWLGPRFLNCKYLYTISPKHLRIPRHFFGKFFVAALSASSTKQLLDFCGIASIMAWSIALNQTVSTYLKESASPRKHSYE